MVMVMVMVVVVVVMVGWWWGGGGGGGYMGERTSKRAAGRGAAKAAKAPCPASHHHPPFIAAVREWPVARADQALGLLRVLHLCSAGKAIPWFRHSAGARLCVLTALTFAPPTLHQLVFALTRRHGRTHTPSPGRPASVQPTVRV